MVTFDAVRVEASIGRNISSVCTIIFLSVRHWIQEWYDGIYDGINVAIDVAIVAAIHIKNRSSEQDGICYTLTNRNRLIDSPQAVTVAFC